MKRLITPLLRPGMITAEDIFSLYGQLLIARDTVLTDSMISIMSVHGVVNVLVHDKRVAHEDNEPDSYSQKIKNSVEFKQFKILYEEEINQLRDRLNLLCEGDDVDIEYFFGAIQRLVNKNTNGARIFNFLQNLREYDESVYAHCLNVGMICNVFAQWLVWSQDDILTATLSGLLHDVGKIQTPESILKKPSKLTKDEFETVKRHTISGYHFLKAHEIDQDVCHAALMHHERCDGTGYPLKLGEKKITKFAKMVAIADVYDAMTAARVYRGPLCPFKVIDLFEQEGFQKYDPSMIIPFLENIVTTYISHSCLLSDGRSGTIVYINRHRLSRPMVKCQNKYIDLSTTPDLSITSLI